MLTADCVGMISRRGLGGERMVRAGRGKCCKEEERGRDVSGREGVGNCYTYSKIFIEKCR